MAERPRIILTTWIKGEPFSYSCSLCGQPFILPEDRNPREGMEEVWAAFNEHVEEDHSAAKERNGALRG